MTARLYVIGDPITHSLSPALHGLWLQSAGLDATYEPLRVVRGELVPALDRLARAGVRGANVTLPHKAAALAASDEASAAARTIGAANTLSYRASGGWRADNSDAPGLMAALARVGETRLADRRVVIIGAGGAARAAVFALHQAGARLSIVNRTPHRAEALSDTLTGGAATTAGLDTLAREVAGADLVIHTSSAGHGGAALALPPGGQRLFFDMSYGAAAAAQLDVARTGGWRAEDGLGMLVAQAAVSFEIWFGIRPDLDAALGLARRKVEAG